MPLIHSGSRQAVGQNISEMVHAGHPRDQAIAAALRNARQYGGKFASGGFAPPLGQNIAERRMASGFLHSPIPGRTDKLPITVSGGAYVLPADHVAALGQGNSLAGANIVNKMFKMGPFGQSLSGVHARTMQQPHLNLLGKQQRTKFAAGGAPQAGPPTPIIAAGGEIVIPPEKILEKFGDLKHGHKALDRWVVETRKEHIKQLKGLKPPRQD